MKTYRLWIISLLAEGPPPSEYTLKFIWRVL